MKPLPKLVLAAALALVLPREGRPQEAQGGAPVALPPVFVEASRGEPWRYFAVPGFEVISHCPDAFNQEYARSLALSGAARDALLPEAYWGTLASPLMVILYDREPQAGDPVGQGSPIDLGWSEVSGSPAGPMALDESHPLLAGDGATFISCGNYWRLLGQGSAIVADPDSALRIARRAPRFPDWFAEGLVGRDGVYAHHWIEPSASGAQLVLPAASWMSPAQTEAIRREPGRPVALPPLAELLTARPDPTGAAWRSEAALFVRWGLLGGERAAFLAFVDRSCREPVTEDGFREAFGFGYAEGGRRLSAFLPGAVARAVRIPLGPSAAPGPTRDATSVEVARILGEWGRLEGRSPGLQAGDYERSCLEQADRLFRHAKERGVRDPLFLAAYGLYEQQVGDGAAARAALEGAVKAGVVRPQAYLALARLRLEDALPSPESGIGDLGEAEFQSILGLIRTAQFQDPALPAGYELEARLLEHGPAAPTHGELGALAGRLALFPRDARLAYRVATVFRRMGYGQEAREIAARALALADDPGNEALLRSLIAQSP